MNTFDCPFCDRLFTGAFADERGQARAFADAFPVSKGHHLVVSSEHCADFFELPDATQADMLLLARDVQRWLATTLMPAPAGFNVGLNAGAAAGQTVPHAHLHVIPRYPGDVPDPRGGVRWVLPDQAAYWEGL